MSTALGKNWILNLKISLVWFAQAFFWKCSLRWISWLFCFINPILLCIKICFSSWWISKLTYFYWLLLIINIFFINFNFSLLYWSLESWWGTRRMTQTQLNRRFSRVTVFLEALFERIFNLKTLLTSFIKFILISLAIIISRPWASNISPRLIRAILFQWSSLFT